MASSLRAGLTFIVGLTLVLGVAYPLLATAGSSLIAPDGSDGSLLKVDGKTVGSRLIGQSFAGEPGYFQSRPSQTDYSADATAFSNLGPNGRDTAAAIKANLALYLKREGRFYPGLDSEDVPASAVMGSASGIDPHIEPADARIQAHRVAESRDMSLGEVNDLIDRQTTSRTLGVLGEPVINVLELNLALERETK